MKYLMLISFLFVIQCTVNSQQTASQLIKEGKTLHDKEDYTGAIAKYDAALALDPSNEEAQYEKAYSLTALRKFDEAENLLKPLLKTSKDKQLREASYITYGTLLDQRGDSKKSLNMYEDGIKEFPKSYLMHFNKGVTEMGLDKKDDAIASFQDALRQNPNHASSHNVLGRLVAGKSRVEALLSIMTFLIIEPEGERAQANAAYLNQLLNKGVEKKDDKNVTIYVDADMLKNAGKKKTKEDDFSMADFMLSLMAASEPDSIKSKPEGDKLTYKINQLIDMIDQPEKNEKGFFKTFYVPMFKEMRRNDLVRIACYVALSSTNDEEVSKWLKENKDDVGGFYRWFENYHWTKE